MFFRTTLSWNVSECVYPNGDLFICREIRDFFVVPNRRFVFYSEIQSFESCTKRAIHSTAIVSLTTKYEIFKVVPNWPYVFLLTKYKFELHWNGHSLFWLQLMKMRNCFVFQWTFNNLRKTNKTICSFISKRIWKYKKKSPVLLYLVTKLLLQNDYR